MKLLILFAALAQDDQQYQRGLARQAAQDSRRDCEALMSRLEGIVSVNYAGVDDEFRLLIVARDLLSKREARRLLDWKDEYRGMKIHWTVSQSAAKNAEKPRPASAPAPQREEYVARPGHLPETRANPWNAAATDCDIIAQHLGMKTKERYNTRPGRWSAPCQLMRRSVVGAGGGHTYVYTKHRNECPVRLGRVGVPSWADNFVNWVFDKGFTGVARAGFTWPFELRADDKLWTRQATGDLMTRLPHIRELAEWERTPLDPRSGKTGSMPPGTGWSWSQPGGGPPPTYGSPTGGCPNCGNR